MLGGEAIPYGKLWRTGANEPTVFFAPVPLKVAGIDVPPGVYSLYTVPGAKEWEVIVNRSVSQWGHESEYTDKVKAQELGRGKVKSESISPPSRDVHHPGGPQGERCRAGVGVGKDAGEDSLQVSEVSLVILDQLKSPPQRGLFAEFTSAARGQDDNSLTPSINRSTSSSVV